MVHRVTFVCEANICRSPLMAFTFAVGDSDPFPGDWTVTSRGTQVGGRRAEICEVSASLIVAEDGGPEFVAAHRSAPIAASHLNGQDLILVASMAERAAVARLNPDLRSRTFTLREAVALGREPITAGERALAASDTAGARVRLSHYPEVLHRRRALMLLPQAPVRPRWLKPAPHPLDIADAHHLRMREHVATLRAVREDTIALRSQLARYLVASTE